MFSHLLLFSSSALWRQPFRKQQHPRKKQTLSNVVRNQTICLKKKRKKEKKNSKNKGKETKETTEAVGPAQFLCKLEDPIPKQI